MKSSSGQPPSGRATAARPRSGAVRSKTGSPSATSAESAGESAIPSPALADALYDVGAERKRQLVLKEQGRFKYTPSDDGITDWQRLGMILEEVGEVSRNLLARDGLVTDGDKSNAALRKELSQVAALSVAWMERL